MEMNDDVRQLIETCDNQELEIKELRSQLKACQVQLSRAIEYIGAYKRTLKDIQDIAHRNFHSEEKKVC